MLGNTVCIRLSLLHQISMSNHFLWFEKLFSIESDQYILEILDYYLKNKVNSPLEQMGSKESLNVRKYSLYPFVLITSNLNVK